MNLFKKSITGIDLGKKVLKMAHCTFGRGEPVVKRTYAIDLPDEYPDDTHLDISLDLINRTRKIHRIPLDNVAIVCPRHLYESMNVTLPAMPVKELRAALRWELKKAAGVDPELLNFDYYTNAVAERESEYFVYYSQRSRIDGLVAKFENYGIRVKYVDVEEMTHLAAFSAVYTDDGTPKCFFDMGASQSRVIIAVGGTIRFTRELNYGMRTVYDRMKSENLGEIELRDLIEIHGCSDPRIASFLTDYLTDVLYEISRSIDYFTVTYKQPTPTNVLLSGGVFRIPGVYEYFQRSLVVPATLNNVLEAVGYPDEEMRKCGFMFNLAVGAGLR